MLPQPDHSRVQPGENNTEDNLRPLETIMPLLDELLGLEVSFERVSNQAMICLDKIGNKYRARYAVVVETDGGFAELPPNCDKIESVLAVGTSFLSTGNTTTNGALTPSTAPIEPTVYVESNSWPELNLVPNTTPDQMGMPVRLGGSISAIDAKQYGGVLVDYTFRDGGVYVGYQQSTSELVRQAVSTIAATGSFDAPVFPQQLLVFYHGRVGDERGYPLITPEEALACAYYVNFVSVQKRYFMREATVQDFQLAQQLKDQHISQARLAPIGSSNALDKVLDESKRYHRHFFTDDFTS